MDSIHFLLGSLDSLFETVQKSCCYNIIKHSYLTCDFLNKEKVLQCNSSDRLIHLIRKGSFRYECVRSASDYSLPHLVLKYAFCNSITIADITDEKFNLASEIWGVFEIKSV